MGVHAVLLYAVSRRPRRCAAGCIRPVFGSQGGRLTAWECEKMGVPYTLICDNMAASLMRDGKAFPPVAPPASRCPCRTSHGA